MLVDLLFSIGYKLENGETLALHIADINVCLYTCMQNLKCQSFSISKDQQGLCLLHHKTSQDKGDKLVKADGWMFVETDEDEDVVRNT